MVSLSSFLCPLLSECRWSREPSKRPVKIRTCKRSACFKECPFPIDLHSNLRFQVVKLRKNFLFFFLAFPLVWFWGELEISYAGIYTSAVSNGVAEGPTLQQIRCAGVSLFSFSIFDSADFCLQICDLHQQIDDGKLTQKKSYDLVTIIKSAWLLIFLVLLNT